MGTDHEHNRRHVPALLGEICILLVGLLSAAARDRAGEVCDDGGKAEGGGAPGRDFFFFFYLYSLYTWTQKKMYSGRLSLLLR